MGPELRPHKKSDQIDRLRDFLFKGLASAISRDPLQPMEEFVLDTEGQARLVHHHMSVALSCYAFIVAEHARHFSP